MVAGPVNEIDKPIIKNDYLSVRDTLGLGGMLNDEVVNST